MLKGISVQGVYNPKATPARVGSTGGVPGVGGGAAAYDAGVENARGLLDVGKQALGIIAREYQQRQTGLVDEALLGVDRAFSEWKADYEEKRRGVLGINARRDFMSRWDELAREAIKKFGHDDEVASEVLRRRLLEHGMYAVRNGAAFQAREEKAWKESQFASQLAWFERHVDENPLDSAAIAAEAQNLVSSWQAKNPGLDSGELRAKLAGMVQRKRVEALLADDSRLEEAEELIRGMNVASGAPRPGSKSERALAGYNFGFVKNLDGRFATYASREDGLAAIGERVLRYSDTPRNNWHAKTVRDVINIYAPESDGNRSEKYARELAGWMGVSVDDKLDFRDPQTLAGFIKNIPRKEHGAFVKIGDDEALAAANAVLAGYKPKTSGSIADSGRGSGGALQGLGITPGEKARLERALAARYRERMEKAEAATVQSWLGDTRGMALEARAADLYERLAGVNDPEARRRMERMGADELRFERERIDSANKAAGLELARALKENNYSPAQARTVINAANCSEEAKEIARQSLYARAAKPTPENRHWLAEGYKMIDSGLLQSNDERELFAIEHHLTDTQVEKLLGYGGMLEDVAQSDVVNAMIEAGWTPREFGPLPDNIRDIIASRLERGKKATRKDLQDAAATLILQGKVDGRSMPYYEAINKGQAGKFALKVAEHERAAIDDALKRRGLPITEKNRGIMNMIRKGLYSSQQWDKGANTTTAR